MLERTFWNTNGSLDSDSDDPIVPEAERYQVATEEEATLIGSRLKDSKAHAPVIDIDLPCKLVPSSTEGHFHLYIDHPMTWKQYKALLAAMVDAGIVEKGYYSASLARGQTFVRKPGLKKETSSDGGGEDLLF